MRRPASVAACASPTTSTGRPGLFPVAYTIGTDFKTAHRKPLGEVLAWNGFDTVT